MNSFNKALLATVAMIGLSVSAFADTITLPNPNTMNRTAWLNSAVSGAWGASANPNAALVEANYPLPDPFNWAKEGELTGNGTNDWLKVTLTSGSWGGSTVAGNWAINAAFWNTWNSAVISMHVGNGGGDPDYFMWLITPGATSGTFALTKNSGGGGGISNLKLWGANLPTTRVPDGGTTALLLGVALLGFGLIARRKR